MAVELPHFNKKVWLVVIAGAVALGLYLRHRSSSSLTAPGDSTGDTTDTGTSGDGYQGGYGYGGGGLPPNPTSPTPSPPKLRPPPTGKLVWNPRTKKWRRVSQGTPTHVVEIRKGVFRRELGRRGK